MGAGRVPRRAGGRRKGGAKGGAKAARSLRHRERARGQCAELRIDFEQQKSRREGAAPGDGAEAAQRRLRASRARPRETRRNTHGLRAKEGALRGCRAAPRGCAGAVPGRRGGVAAGPFAKPGNEAVGAIAKQDSEGFAKPGGSLGSLGEENSA